MGHGPERRLLDGYARFVDPRALERSQRDLFVAGILFEVLATILTEVSFIAAREIWRSSRGARTSPSGKSGDKASYGVKDHRLVTEALRSPRLRRTVGQVVEHK